MQAPSTQIKLILDHLADFTSVFGHIDLRPYQVEAAEAVVQSILANDGESFVWKFSRQGGKDETLAALYQYIMTILAHRDISIISACPTFLPQTRLAIERLADRLGRHLALKRSWKRQAGHIFRIRRARTIFLSAQSHANVVGATAWPLLVMNEAQDILPAVYDRRFAPMAAANNATRLFCGTAWTRDSLLAREERFCRLKEQRDGRRRVFIVDGPQIAKVHPPYGKFLESEVARLGADHPIVLSQYLCLEIDAQSAMFTPARLALIFGSHPNHNVLSSSTTFTEQGTPLHFRSPENGEGAKHAEGDSGVGPIVNPKSEIVNPLEGLGVRSPIVNRESEILNSPPSTSRSTPKATNGQPSTRAFLIDVAGQDEHHQASPLWGGREGGPDSSRDSTTLSIVELDLSTLETLQAPTYRVVHREAWQGLNHLVVFGKLKALAESWDPQYIVIDATGVGEGLWAMLDRAFRTRVIPVKFTQQEKSEIGWRFLSIIETGRFHDCSRNTPLHFRSPENGEGHGVGPVVRSSIVNRTPLPGASEIVNLQYSLCQSEILPGPAKTLRWGVPDGTRGPDGELVHDDFILADALVAKLDQLEWHLHSPTLIIPAVDPLEEMSRFR